MIRVKMRFWVLGSMLLLPALSIAQAGDEVRIISVDANAFSAYGHWISDDGIVELRYSDGVTYADGWQISPELPLHDLGSAQPSGITDMASVSPKRKVVLQVCVMRDSMFAAGDSPETVIAACKDALRKSGMVDLSATCDTGEKIEGGIRRAGGPNYDIFWVDYPPSTMCLGKQEMPPSPENMKAVRERQSHGLFLALAAHLEAGNMYLISSYPLPTGAFIPHANRDAVAALLRKSAKAASPITAETWQNGDLVGYGFAEQARNPLPLDRKGVR